MDKDLSKRLDVIEKKLDTLLKRTDPKHVKREIEGIPQFLDSGRRKGYAGVPADDPRLRGSP
jgi:hypothetical protein